MKRSYTQLTEAERYPLGPGALLDLIYHHPLFVAISDCMVYKIKQ